MESWGTPIRTCFSLWSRGKRLKNTQPVFICSKSTTETLAWNLLKVTQLITNVILVSLLLPLTIFHTSLWCFHFWLWIRKWWVVKPAADEFLFHTGAPVNMNSENQLFHNFVILPRIPKPCNFLWKFYN